VARLAAEWIAAGFVHGVLNTDNINITGESFDYGPWRFSPSYDPKFTAAYFDQTGLYAFGRQPDTLAWNLIQLALCLLPLAEKERLEEALGAFGPAFHEALAAAVLNRLGLRSAGTQADMEFTARWFTFLLESQAPYEASFFDWRGGTASVSRAEGGPRASLYAAPAFAPVREAMARHESAPNALDHPYFRRAEPCTMLIDEVEAIWAPIAESDDWSRFERKLDEIRLLREAYAIESS
jgi:uncharacterized protein YdiU (UPF0061 family)